MEGAKRLCDRPRERGRERKDPWRPVFPRHFLGCAWLWWLIGWRELTWAMEARKTGHIKQVNQMIKLPPNRDNAIAPRHSNKFSPANTVWNCNRRYLILLATDCWFRRCCFALWIAQACADQLSSSLSVKDTTGRQDCWCVNWVKISWV